MSGTGDRERKETKALAINEGGRWENQYKTMKLNLTAHSHSSPSEIREEGPAHSVEEEPRGDSGREYSGEVTKDSGQACGYFWFSFIISVHPGFFTGKCRNSTMIF